MKLLLHIGPHKTGSSTIQGSLSQRKQALAEQGVYYHTEHPMGVWSLALKFAIDTERNHPAIRRVFPTDQDALNWSESCWRRLEHGVASSGAQLYILSSEHFASLPETGLAEMIARLKPLFSDIDVLTYVRDPASLYLSSVQQHIQGGVRLNALKTPANYRYSARKQIEKYTRHAPEAHIIARNFDRSNLVGGNVVSDFSHVLSELGIGIELPRLSENSSLPGAVIAWLLTVNETWDRKVLSPERKRVLKRLSTSARIAELPRLSFSTSGFAETIRFNADADLRWLNQNYLAHQRKLALSEVPSKDQIEAFGQNQLRDWMMDYLTPGALKLIAEEALET